MSWSVHCHGASRVPWAGPRRVKQRPLSRRGGATGWVPSPPGDVGVLAGALLPAAAALGASLAAFGARVPGVLRAGPGREGAVSRSPAPPPAPGGAASQAAYLAFARGGARDDVATDWDDDDVDFAVGGVAGSANGAAGEGSAALPGGKGRADAAAAVAASADELWEHLEARIARSAVGAAPQGPSPPLALASLGPAVRRALLRSAARGLRSALDTNPAAVLGPSMAPLAGQAVRATLEAFLPAVAPAGTRPRAIRVAIDAATDAAVARFAAPARGGNPPGPRRAAERAPAPSPTASPFGAKDGPYAALCRHLALGSAWGGTGEEEDEEEVSKDEGKEFPQAESASANAQGVSSFSSSSVGASHPSTLPLTAAVDALLVDRYAELLLDDLVVVLADAAVTALLGCALELEGCGVWASIFGTAGLRSSRDIERLRNRVAWDAVVRRCLSDPVAVYEDRVTCWGLTAAGLAAVRVRHSRKRELRALQGIPLAVTLFLEAQDVAAPILRDVLQRLGGLVSFLLVSLIGRSLGLVYRGILESARQGGGVAAPAPPPFRPTVATLLAREEGSEPRPLASLRRWAADASRRQSGPGLPA